MSMSGITSVTTSIPTGYGTQAGGSPCCNEEKSNASEKTDELTSEEQKQVSELQKRDQEVRAHEMAHVAAGGQYVQGGAHFEFETGPDGKRYAVGGEVSIDASAVSGDPEATVRKMQVVRKAALAPANPSGKDRAVAASASQKQNTARKEQVQEKKEVLETKTEEQEAGHGGKSEKTAGYSKSGITISTNPSASSSLINIIA